MIKFKQFVLGEADGTFSDLMNELNDWIEQENISEIISIQDRSHSTRELSGSWYEVKIFYKQ